MSAVWNGKPPGDAAERDGSWHWLALGRDNNSAQPFVWTHNGWWINKTFWRHRDMAPCEWRYIAPCPTPTEVQAIAAATAEAMEQAGRMREMIPEAAAGGAITMWATNRWAEMLTASPYAQEPPDGR